MGYVDHMLMELCFDPNMALVCGKKRVRRLVWRVRAEIKRQMIRKKQSFRFNYDPFTYSLNFDDGNFGFLC